jgi:hypothetical protein
MTRVDGVIADDSDNDAIDGSVVATGVRSVASQFSGDDDDAIDDDVDDICADAASLAALDALVVSESARRAARASVSTL